MQRIHVHLKEALAQTERELSAAQILVRNLSDQRLQLRKNLNSTAPISLLPWDLKHNIFLTVNDDEDGYQMPALSLAAVCAEWRQMVLDMPQLWGKIYLPFYHQKIKSGDILLDHAKLSLVDDWLERGKQVPLYITVFLREEMEDEEFSPGELSQVLFLDLLNRHSKRWRHIFLDYALVKHFELHMFRQPGDLPLLRSLKIFSDDGDDPHWDNPDEPLFKTSYFLHAPSLREAEIYPYTIEEIILPWDQLEKLDGYGHLDDVYGVLSSSHHLLECTLCVDSRIDIHPYKITVPKLQTLCLDEADCSLLEFLDVPALKDYRHSLIARYDFDALSGLIKRSSCRLNVLHIDAVTIDDSFLNCIQLLSSLIELKLNLTSYNDNALDALWLPDSFIKSLNPDKDESALLPKLEVFSYTGSTDFRFRTLFTLLRERCQKAPRAVSQITRLSIRSTNNILGFDGAALKELGFLQEEGIEIEIRASLVRKDWSRSWADSWLNNFPLADDSQ